MNKANQINLIDYFFQHQFLALSSLFRILLASLTISINFNHISPDKPS